MNPLQTRRPRRARDARRAGAALLAVLALVALAAARRRLRRLELASGTPGGRRDADRHPGAGEGHPRRPDPVA